MNNLLLDEYPLILLPSLAEKIGLNEAILLQQIHFWIGKKKHLKDGRYWVYNTYKGWEEQFPFWSVSTIRRTITSLEKQKLLFTSNYNKAGFDNTKWYTINYNQLKSVSRPSVQNEQTMCSEWTSASVQNEQTNTIDYTETNNIDSSSNAHSFYQNNFGMITPFIAENINQWIDDLNEPLVVAALERAAKQNKQFNYAEGILKDWYKNNVRTIEGVEAKESQFTNKRKPKNTDKDWADF